MFNLFLIIYITSALINLIYVYKEMKEISILDWIVNKEILIITFIPIINSIIVCIIIIDLLHRIRRFHD